ncbi:hypothetical protein GPALN_006895 [Globodera pallida]|nr:hypothetical protein GPALN_006895 [Globodera pallida]
MDPAQSECTSNTGGDQQAKGNKYKRRGQIVFRMQKFKEFSEGRGPKYVLSAPVVYINGLPWKIMINRCDAHVGLYVKCIGDETGLELLHLDAQAIQIERTLPLLLHFHAEHPIDHRRVGQQPMGGHHNKYKRSGQIVLRMPNFKEFSEGLGSNKVFSAPVEYINGLPWRIKISHLDDYVGLFLKCYGDETDAAWSCRAALQFSVVSCTKSGDCLRKRGRLDIFDIYTAEKHWGWNQFIKFEELLDPKNDLYDEKADAVTFKAEIVAEVPIGMPGLRPEDALMVNGELVNVNKHMLAGYSKVFQILFFGENAEEIPKVQIDEVPDAVANFGRLIATMDPLNVDLDDNKYKRSGQIVLRMPNFKEFSEGLGSNKVFSAPVEYINGLPWRIKISHLDDYVGLFLKCYGDETDAAWSCRAALQFSVVSCTKSGDNLRRTLVVISRPKTISTNAEAKLCCGCQNSKNFLKDMGRRSPSVKGSTQCTAVYINGLPWRISIEHLDAHVGIFLQCDGDETDAAWTCRAAAQCGVVSCKKSGECLMKRGNLDRFNVYTANSCSWGCLEFIKFEELMDLKNGFYDEKQDAVTFKAELVVEEPNGMPGVRPEDALLVNGELVHVNKYMLAAYSTFFRTLFFGENAEEMPKVQIDEVPNAVTNFERLIATMDPLNVDLDDECVEDVFLLANRFLLASAEKRCVEFLLKKSKKSAIFKFRMAHQCGIIGMKELILKEMTEEDFLIAAGNYMDNYSENIKLGAEAMKELSERHKELFGTE